MLISSILDATDMILVGPYILNTAHPMKYAYGCIYFLWYLVIWFISYDVFYSYIYVYVYISMFFQASIP